MTAPAMASARILVVDDDAGVRESVSWMLEEHGYEVVALPGGTALLAELERRTPDLVLLDIVMPDADGVQLLARMKGEDRWRDVPVLMVSSAPPEENTVRALGLGAADFVRKPFRARELVARIQAQLRAGAQLRAARDALDRASADLARAREAVENRRQVVDILHEVTGDLSANEVYHLLARRVARALAVSHCAVILTRPGDAVGVVTAAYERPQLSSAPVELDRFPEIRRALDTGQPQLVEDVATNALYGGQPAWGLDGGVMPARSTLALPFTLDGGRAGVFLLRRTRDEAALTGEDTAFAHAVIQAGAAVVQRAQAIETTRAANARLEQLATTDPLTQVLNRRALVERLAREMERAVRADRSVALLMIDLDHFKRVNDTHGHLVGDDALRDVARLLLGEARGSDAVARYGGEEFLVVLPDTDDEGAVAFAERVRERVERHEFRGRDDAAMQMTASIGVATFPSARIETGEDLLARADAALYRAKADGRNRVRA
jgi:two-component system cell cycle response regulator